MTPDWTRLEELLIDSSETAIRRFVASIEKRKLLAIGYVFELGNNSPQFDLCANVSGSRDFVHDFDDEDRWNSGDYEYPAGLLDSRCELGSEWNAANKELHAIANDDDSFGAIYDGIVGISSRIIHQVLEHGGALGEFGLGRRLNGFWIEFARSAHNGPLPNFVFRVDGRRY